MYEGYIREIRDNIKSCGWRLILYQSKNLLKSYACTGVCDETTKTIQLATQRLADYEIIWFLAHEFAHLQQIKTYQNYPKRDIESAFDLYTQFVDEKKPIPQTKKAKSREIVIEYEFDADLRAYEWMKKRKIRIKGYKQASNCYSYVIRYAFASQNFISIGRKSLIQEFNIRDKFFSFSERQKPLTAKEFDFMANIYKKQKR